MLVEIWRGSGARLCRAPDPRPLLSLPKRARLQEPAKGYAILDNPAPSQEKEKGCLHRHHCQQTQTPGAFDLAERRPLGDGTEHPLRVDDPGTTHAIHAVL